MMQQLPIGEQNFANLRQLNMLYVDKTESIHQLLQGSRYNFLSRPRRFGKSLTLSTIRHIFQGEKELFTGLWIEDQWNWALKHPVIHLSFNQIGYAEIGLAAALSKALRQFADDFGVEVKSATPGLLLRELILATAAKHGTVVLLIDEYDKPLIDYLNKNELPLAKENRAILKNFYSGLKDDAAQAALRFFLITGLSKFNEIGWLSDLNFLSDLSIGNNCNVLFGYTEEELLHNFKDYIDVLSHSLPNSSPEALINRIREWYGGYSWDGRTKVYNPFSILLLFQQLHFEDHWYQNDKPDLLLRLLKKQKVDMENELWVSGALFNACDIENIDVRTLLFQIGYLTIKQFDPYRNRYTLGYPNQEIEHAMSHLQPEHQY